MSIYATLWSIQIQDPASPSSNPRWVTVTAQAVPPHIGSPTTGCGYEAGDPYADFLPPPVNTNKDREAEYNRAVVFITESTKKGTARNGQEYVNPLLVLSGEKYAKMPFQTLLNLLEEAIRSGPRVVAEYFDSKGDTHIVRDDIMQPHKLWIEQCEAAVGIEAEFGTEKALSYLIGEKFINFLEAAETDANFRAEIPSFVAEIKTMFERWQLAEYLEKARQNEPFDPSVYEDEDAKFENQLDISQGAAELLLVERAKEWLLGEGE
ncbi:MAG: hypothetical protein ABSE63_19025 [Thermoguttaceae bacterium]|jgi:hypothetical protein